MILHNFGCVWFPMIYTKTEISKLALGQLKVDKLQRAVDAFNGFKALFGRPWIDEHFQGVQSADLVLYVLSLWENWLLVNRLDKSEELMKRWKSGMEESGVSTEIGVIAYIVSTGAKVELFPKVGRRVPDLHFRQTLYGYTVKPRVAVSQKLGKDVPAPCIR